MTKRIKRTKEYTVNNIYNEQGLTLSEIITRFLLLINENDFDIGENNVIISNDIISNL